MRVTKLSEVVSKFENLQKKKEKKRKRVQRTSIFCIYFQESLQQYTVYKVANKKCPLLIILKRTTVY